MAIIHDVTSHEEWEAACADPHVSIIRIRADIPGPIVYTGRNGSPGDTVLITSAGGKVFAPEYPRGAIELPATARGITVGSTPGSPIGWVGARRPTTPATIEVDRHGLPPGFIIRDLR